MKDRPDNLNVYLLYATEDEPLKKELEQHLEFLQRQGHIDLWHEGKILAGMHKTETQRAYIEKAHIILLLLSSNFLSSDCFNELEEDILAALQRQKKGKARVVPVVLRDCLWQMDILQHLKPLPHSGGSIFSQKNRDKAFLEIAQEVREIAQDLKRVTEKIVNVTKKIGEDFFGEIEAQPFSFHTTEQPKAPKAEVKYDAEQSQMTLEAKDEVACQLIAALIYALKFKAFEEGLIDVIQLLHPSLLTRKGTLRPDFKRNNYEYARKRVQRYEYPIRIVEKSVSKRKSIGALSKKQSGEEVVYRIAKQEEDGGLPALIRVFFPDSGQAARLSNFSL